MNFEFESQRTRKKDLQAYKEAFDYYDWNKSGIISVKVNFITGQVLSPPINPFKTLSQGPL